MGRKLTLFWGALTLACALSSVASFGADISHNSGTSTADLSLNISGHIKPKCEIKIADNRILLSFNDKSGTHDIDVKVDCNQYLTVEMQSLNGGFLNENSSTFLSSSGFTGFLPYDLEFSVRKNNAKALRLNSEEIKGIMSGGSVGVIPYEANANLSIKWNPDQNLFGGRYRDVIVIRASSKGR